MSIEITPHYKKSLTRETLTKMGIRIAVVIVGITFVSYMYIFSRLKTQTLEDLEEYIHQRGIRESLLFTLAIDNQKTFAQDFLKRLTLMGDDDPHEKIESLFVRHPDGTLRIREPFYKRDGITGVISMLGNSRTMDSDGGKGFTKDLRRVLVIAYDMLAQYGPAWHSRFVNLYITLPENGILMYWPDTPWGVKAGLWEINAKMTLNNMQDEDELVVVINETPHTDKQQSWSNPYYDFAAGNWMVSATQPVSVEGKYILSVSNDILLHELIERTITQHLEGTYNLILDANGKLIAHPKFMDAIQAQGGDFPIMDADDPNLKRIFKLTGEYGNGIIDNTQDHEYLAVTRLEGPDWYFVTVFPKAIISEIAFKTARFILILGIISLLLEISILYFVLKKQVATPLTHLMQATNRIASGDFAIELNVERPDEVGHLANLFNTMSGEINAREEALKKARLELERMNENLEQRVMDRTVQLEAANQELEAFAYSVSHDLRAPLRHIDGFMELLQKRTTTALDQQSRHYMDTISESAQKMGLLIDDLLSFSRMGRHALSVQPVDLEPLVREVIRELEPDAAGREIEWRIADLPAVRGDAIMLHMVLGNLIANAVKFTRPREKARIEIGSLPGGDAEAVIFVRDNGVGFDMAYGDKLFDVFQRLHRAEEFEGTGIGLANVRRIIARHGGRTWAEGKVDQGATFFFSLPHPPQGV
jgi:signal transduction histidine kinase